MSDDRLARIEAQQQTIIDILVSIARVEERQTNQEIQLKTAVAKIADLKDQVDDLDEFKATVRVINRVFWIFVTAAATIGAGAYFYNGDKP